MLDKLPRVGVFLFGLLVLEHVEDSVEGRQLKWIETESG